MALKIKEKNGAFYIEGPINATTVKQFKAHVEFLILYTRGITLNIDGVNGIDVSGMNALVDLYNMALMSNKSFFVVGESCKEIFDDFENDAAA
ncbi:hypothetical protein MHTCC0001_07870 [Flavobacteriaceae bacterium MHTCC 0001]